MFFSTYVLTKKGPLAKVWLAAHWDRRLTRNEVKVVDLSQTIMHIVRPVVPIALRTSGELLVGVVRIYVLKVKHLLREANEATLFLRVTTMTAKGSASGNVGASVGAHSGAAVTDGAVDDKTAAMDGVLVSGKGNVDAVTFNWNSDVATKHGSLPDAAQAMADARFDAIADLLGAQQVSGVHRPDGLLAQAWYTVEPSSQAVEELHNTQQDYDEIALMRADLMAFGERASDSSASKSKSSLSSIEKGRGSAAGIAGAGGALGDDVPFPAVADELDIGVPMPEELASDIPLLGTQHNLSGAGFVPEDPFAIPDAAAAPARPERRVRPVNVLDLAATTLPREVFERCMQDRSDVLNAEPRRGPLDEQEEADRYTIAGSASPAASAASANSSAAAGGATTATPLSAAAAEVLSLAEASLLSAQPSPTLRGLYASALQRQVREAVEAAAAATAAVQGHRSETIMAGGAAPEDSALLHSEADAFTMTGQQQQRTLDEEQQRAARKRAREEAESDDPRTLSRNAVKTLQRIREAVSQSRLVSATGSSNSRSLVGAACTLRDVCSGFNRREAARTFVDVLALASKQFVRVHQEAAGGGVEIHLLKASASVLAQ